jgi:hypothetical protein
MSNYHYLVAGLPEINFDGSKANFSIARFKEEIYSALSKKDAEKIDLFFYAWDNENLLKMLSQGTDAELPRTGHFTREELAELMTTAKNGDARTAYYPAYMYDFLDYYYANAERENQMFDDVLASYYYEYATRCNSKFLSEWFTFNQNLSNLQVAYIARKYKMNISEHIVGNNETAEAIRTSSARDFGLSGTFDYLETVQRLCESDKLQERERQIDELRWKWLEENSVFEYFSVERIFVFLQKLDIVQRWSRLDIEAGTQRYKELIESLKSGLILNDEDYQ